MEQTSMNKTTEALKLAEEALSKIMSHPCSEHSKALAAIREALADHVPDATKMVAEPVKQEPMYFALTKNHTWMSVTEKDYECFKPEYRMKCYAESVDAKAILAEALEEAEIGRNLV